MLLKIEKHEIVVEIPQNLSFDIDGAESDRIIFQFSHCWFSVVRRETNLAHGCRL